jgi:hypothetical protein
MMNDLPKYTFRDYTKGTLIAPLAAFPAALFGMSVFLIINGFIEQLAGEYGIAILQATIAMLLTSVLTAYFATGLFGAISLWVANQVRYRYSYFTGAAVGVLWATTIVMFWMFVFPANPGPFDYASTSWGIVFPIAILSGLLVSILYIKLVTR